MTDNPLMELIEDLQKELYELKLRVKWLELKQPYNRQEKMKCL